MLPSLTNLRIDSKRKRAIHPCHDELRYEDGETVNRDHNQRVQGGSSKFTRVTDCEPRKELPFGTSLMTREQVAALSSRTQTSWETVLGELYSDRASPPTTPSAAQREAEAFVRRFDNQVKPQFYLRTVERAAILSHIQPDGVFWSAMWDETPDPVVGDVCYTNGFVWTNPNPRWAWKNRADSRIIRVRIEIPAGTQVIVDRSPVYGGLPCEFDEYRESLFPDVLLGPAEFRVTDVVRYRSTQADYAYSDEPRERFRYVDPRDRGVAVSDVEYAELRVQSSYEFMDVRAVLLRQIKVPSVGSIQFP